MSATYEIIGRKKSDWWRSLAIDPTMLVFSIVFIGPIFSLLWLAINGFFIGCIHRWRELVIALVGTAVILVSVPVIDVSVEAGWILHAQRPYAELLVAAIVIVGNCWVAALQIHSFILSDPVDNKFRFVPIVFLFVLFTLRKAILPQY